MNNPRANSAASFPGLATAGKGPRLGSSIRSRTAALLGMIVLCSGILFIVFTSLKPGEKATLPVRLGNTTIDYTAPLEKLDPLAFGMDISGYGYPNVFANDAVEQQKLKTLGMRFLRIDLKYSVPGDPTSKIVCNGEGCDTRWTGDEWVRAIEAIGAQPIIIVPYRPVDAVNMLKHFNRDTRRNVRYWIVGNEPDLAGIPATTYSTYFNRVYDAMKAVDPTIKIGGGTIAAYNAPYLQAFLQASGSRVDFVDFHGYAQEGTAPGDYTRLFRIADEYGRSIANLRSLIQRTVPARASSIGIEVGEWELNWGGSAQNNINFHAVWAAAVLGNILKAGGRSLFYADKGNALYGNPHRFIDPYGHVVNIRPDDTNPAYHGIGMFTGEGLFRGFGSTMVSASTSLPAVEVFASDHAKNIVAINTSQQVTRTATFSLKGIASGTVAVWRKDESVLFPNPPVKLGTLALQDGTFTYQLPPLSITTFVVETAPQASSRPSLSAPFLVREGGSTCGIVASWLIAGLPRPRTAVQRAAGRQPGCAQPMSPFLDTA